jgi:hypothetical protein
MESILYLFFLQLTFLVEQVHKEIDDSVQERQDKKEKRKINIKAFKTIMRENEKDRKG